MEAGDGASPYQNPQSYTLDSKPLCPKAMNLRARPRKPRTGFASSVGKPVRALVNFEVKSDRTESAKVEGKFEAFLPCQEILKGKLTPNLCDRNFETSKERHLCQNGEAKRASQAA